MATLPRIGGNYPNGFGSGILVRGMPLQMVHPGEVFWVDENSTRNGRGTFQQPDTTMDAAYSRCVSGRGDVVFVKPGHNEAVSSAAGTLTMDLDNVALIGLGAGDDRPLIYFDTAATADIDITGDNNTISNMRFDTQVASLTAALDCECDWLSIENCKFEQTYAAANYVALKTITLAAGSTGFSFIGNEVDYTRNDSTYANSLVFLEGTTFGMVRIEQNDIVGHFAVAPFDLDDDAITARLIVKHNNVTNLDTNPGVCLLINSATVGVFIENYWGGTKANTVPISDISASFIFENYATDVEGTYGIVFGTATAWT